MRLIKILFQLRSAGRRLEVHRLRLQPETEKPRVRTRGGMPCGARRLRVPTVR
jgi:hypothetical protein